jgi:transcriptional regulator with PAS, ATPase and Fis domain
LNRDYRYAVLVDKNDVVVDVDEHLCQLYGNTIEELCGQNAYAMMPEHSHLFGRVKKGEIIKNFNYLCKAVPVGMADKEFYMTLLPLFGETRDLKEYLGFACTIMHAQNMRDSMNKLVNLGAHFTFDDLLGNNEDFLLVKELAIQAADSISNVLLFGENGTGKEVFAQAIHNGSDRCDKPFITVNCSALPKESIGRVLFGSVDDMTGEGISGKYEQANEGTLFIDEISEMPLEMQAILLKALEEKRVTRLGDTESRKVNVRIITATDSNLTECIKSSRFRLDLYYRINVVSLIIPPLRKRAEDIPLLSEFFLSQFNVSLNRNITAVAESALDRMRRYAWPGNIRELQNVIERCVNTCKSRELTENLLPPEIGQERQPVENYSAEQGVEDTSKPSSAFGSYKAAESEKIKSLMKKHSGNKTSVAAELGMTRTTLYRKLKNISDWEL